jgi:hypothetical protein
MKSAFGVDHGADQSESVEKAFGMGAAAGGLRRLGTGIGQAARVGASRSGQMAGKNLATPGRRALGRGQVRMGQGLKRFSSFAAKRPGAVGGAAVGGAGVTAFGAGAATNSSLNQNKRLQQYR